MIVNWDKLVNVCYLGGYAGDFFSNLLYQNFDPLHDFVGSADTNRYHFNNVSFTKYAFGLKGLKDLLFMHSNLEVYELLKLKLKVSVTELATDNVIYFNMILKIYDICYDPNLQTYISNLSEYMRDAYAIGYLTLKHDSIYIATLHYTRPIHDFNLNDVFPGSKNIILVTDNFKYHHYFLLFSHLKNKQMKKSYYRDSKEQLDSFMNRIPVPFYNMHGIDIGRLIFEPEQTTSIEKKLSDIFDRNIILNRTKLEYYRKKSIEQLLQITEKNDINDVDIPLLRKKIGSVIGF